MGDAGARRVPVMECPCRRTLLQLFLSWERLRRQGNFLNDAAFGSKVLIYAPSRQKNMTMFVLYWFSSVFARLYVLVDAPFRPKGVSQDAFS